MRDLFLHTERLGFGTWAEGDLGLARRLWGDARVTALIGGPFDESQVRERLAREIATQAELGVQYWPLFRLGDGAFVGCCGLRPVPGSPAFLELGFHLCPEHWGQGYATEAAGATIHHAFATLGVHTLIAGHHPANQASRRVLERLGFRMTHLELYPPTGLEHPTYELTAAEFAARA